MDNGKMESRRKCSTMKKNKNNECFIQMYPSGRVFSDKFFYPKLVALVDCSPFV